MPQITCQEVITRFKRSYPACETTFALQLLNSATKTLAISSEIRQKTYDLPVIAGVREFILDPEIFLVSEVYYVRTSALGDSYPLIAVSSDELAEFRIGWRSFGPQSSEPWNFYLGTQSADTSTNPATPSQVAPGNTNVIGFDPMPNITTVGGYPIVQIYASSWIPFGLTDYLPDNVGPIEFWVDAMSASYTKAHVLEEAPVRIQLAKQTEAETMTRLKGNSLQVQTRVQLGFISRRRRI